jgi:hypothetical protein
MTATAAQQGLQRHRSRPFCTDAVMSSATAVGKWAGNVIPAGSDNFGSCAILRKALLSDGRVGTFVRVLAVIVGVELLTILIAGTSNGAKRNR